jgi:hypothetical protein
MIIHSSKHNNTNNVNIETHTMNIYSYIIYILVFEYGLCIYMCNI